MTTSAPPGLDATQRSNLERLVIRARVLLENDLAAQMEGRFGIHLDGTIEDEAALPDDTSVKATRRDLEQIVAHLRTLGEDPPGAVVRLLREAAFTHLNRLIAIRIAEAIGLLPESLANGPQSRGFKDLVEIMPMLAGDYRAYLRLCGDELAGDAPVLFDPRNPLLSLEPSTAAFDDLVALVDDPGTTEIWSAPDTLGWAYQFFNTADERREMREAPAPRNSRELAVRNQFFTPRYVVDFLVQNTIGRRLIENDPASPLLDELPLLVDAPTEPGPALDLEEVKCLDPACGSGHFLLGCYDVLERAWELAGITPSESAPKIVASLWGVDIDARCVQVASAAIVLRARRHCRDLPLPRPNIVTARGLPRSSTDLLASLELNFDERKLVDRISSVLADAPVFGTLLKAEEALEQEIRHAAFGGEAGTLELTDDAFGRAETDLMTHLQAVADRASSSVAERLLAAEAEDALRFVDLLRRRFDVVLMNPPFGEGVVSTREYLRSEYGRAAGELAACFVARAQDLLAPHGRTGVLATRQVLFLDGLEDWRREHLLGPARLEVLVDLGIGVLQGALVEVAAFVMSWKVPRTETAVFIRLLNSRDKSADLLKAVADSDSQQAVPLDRFRSLGKAAIPYWIGEDAVHALGGGGWATLGLEAKTGPQTDDDFRILRLRWELPPSSAASPRWVPVAKGGEYEPYWDDIHLLLDFEQWEKRPRSKEGFTRGGLTYPYRTTSDHCLRILPRGCGFTRGGPAVHGNDEALLLTLASCYTRPYKILVEAIIGGGDSSVGGSAARNYSAPWLSSLPPLDPSADNRSTLLELVRSALASSLALSGCDEESALFVAPIPGGVQRLNSLDTIVSQSRDLFSTCARDRLAVSVFAEELYMSTAGVSRQSCIELWGPHPEELADQIPDKASLSELWEAEELQLVELATEKLGFTRFTTKKSFFADRRLELVARILGCRATNVLDCLAEIPATRRERSEVALSLLSYLVGAAFGRFDVETAGDEKPDIPVRGAFDPLPSIPPGVLEISTLGEASPPVLVDEAGYPGDIARAVLLAEHSYLGQRGFIEDALSALGEPDLRSYIRRCFFKYHLSRYSKSRRKAPIYWPLTVPSKNWGVWVYAPALSRETLYTVASEASRRERLAGEAIVRLQRDQQEGGAGRPARKVAEELDAEEKLAEELRLFRAEAERVAGLGWEPDLDDGIILCAAPLADLFPAWPDAKAARADLRKGKYEWATVAAWADQL